VSGPVSFARAVADFRDGTRTPRRFLEDCLKAISKYDRKVQAFVTLNAAAARKAADASTRRYRAGKPLSPVDGCPIAVKDIIDTGDMPTQMNSPIFKGWRPKADAACVAALRNGGAIIVGKTVTTEFAIGRSGQTRNPWDLRRTPGGSSSGSAAAVATGMASAALGTQTQGSILRPAAYCGIVGFKPTHNVLHTGGIHLLSQTSDHLGVIAATVDDAWRVAAQISLGAASPGVGFLPGAADGVPAARHPRKLIRLFTRGWTETDDETKRGFEALIDQLRARGIDITDRDENADVAELEKQFESELDGHVDLIAYEMRWPFEDYIARYGAKAVGSRIRELVEHAKKLTPARYESLLATRHRLQRAAAGVLARCDGFITLASSGPAPVGLTFTGSRTFPSYASWLGLPAFSLPLLTSRRLPVGVQLIGRAGADSTLCAVARWTAETAGLELGTGERGD
jgi:Asp-tRNA(Asn)/Glu-tRNA(Gln) amidotransferase A subunit family amidase